MCRLVFANAVFFHGAWLLVPPVTRQVGPAALWVGTSGYSYPEWGEAGIYPTGTKAGEMLLLYAREFPVTELNDTWYLGETWPGGARRCSHAWSCGLPPFCSSFGTIPESHDCLSPWRRHRVVGIGNIDLREDALQCLGIPVQEYAVEGVRRLGAPDIS